MLPVNLLAVLVAAVAYFIVGFLFHGPLFGKTWMRLANVVPTGNEKFSDMYGQMFWNLVANFVTAYVLAMVHLFVTTSSAVTTAGGVWCGMSTAFFLWVGFVVTGSSMEVIWMKRSFKLWLFEITSCLVGFLVMGAIIAAM
jgi:hypothetical protein